MAAKTRSFCYVSDLIEGIYRLLLSDYHLPVNIGNPKKSHLQLAHEIVNFTGSPSKMITTPFPQIILKQRQPDITKAPNILNGILPFRGKRSMKVTYELFKENSRSAMPLLFRGDIEGSMLPSSFFIQ